MKVILCQVGRQFSMSLSRFCLSLILDKRKGKREEGIACLCSFVQETTLGNRDRACLQRKEWVCFTALEFRDSECLPLSKGKAILLPIIKDFNFLSSLFLSHAATQYVSRTDVTSGLLHITLWELRLRELAQKC